MASSVMASQTLILRSPNSPSSHLNTKIFAPPSAFIQSKSRTISLLSRQNTIAVSKKKFTVSASSNAIIETPSVNSFTNSDANNPLIVSSTRTLTTLAAVAFAVSKLVLNKIYNLGVHGLGKSLVYSAGPMFFAARASTSGPLNTPFTVIAAGMSKWLDIYSGVLMVRVLLSWFPNIPWDKQPCSAIRDLCDPYLSLFRNIIPPVFNTLDVSPILAFAILGMLGSILKTSTRSAMY